MISRAHVLSIIAALTTILFWAGAFIAIGVAVPHVQPLPLAAARFAIAGFIGLGWLAFAGRIRPGPGDLVRLALCGALGVALYNVLLAAGQRTVDPGAASFIIATQPVFTAVVSGLLFRECWSVSTTLGMAMALSGVALIAWPGGGAGTARGALLVLAAAACSGSYFALQRPLVMRFGAVASATASMLAAGMLLLPWLPEGIAAMYRSEHVLFAVLYLGLGAGVIAYACWMRALEGLGATRSANLLFLMAPLATFMTAFIERTVPTLFTIAGGGLALTGVAIASRRSPPLAMKRKP